MWNVRKKAEIAFCLSDAYIVGDSIVRGLSIVEDVVESREPAKIPSRSAAEIADVRSTSFVSREIRIAVRFDA